MGVNREIEVAFIACPEHERIMTIQALAAMCTPWQRQLFHTVLEQTRGSHAHPDSSPDAIRQANDAGAFRPTLSRGLVHAHTALPRQPN